MTRQSIHDRLMPSRPAVVKPPQAQTSETRTVRSRVYIPLLAVAALVLAGGGGFLAYENFAGARAIAQNALGGQPVGKTVPLPPARPEPPTATAPGSADIFATHASESGVETCANTYVSLGKLLTDGSQFAVQTQTDKTDADRRAVQGVAGLRYEPGNGESKPAGGVIFAVPNGLSCEGNMVRVVPFAQSCQAAEALLPKGSVRQEMLAGTPVFALPTGGQAMLVPAGEGCVAISILRIALGQLR